MDCAYNKQGNPSFPSEGILALCSVKMNLKILFSVATVMAQFVIVSKVYKILTAVSDCCKKWFLAIFKKKEVKEISFCYRN